ncbi:MAG: response regulator transcription factor [Chloroflexota bacterium]
MSLTATTLQLKVKKPISVLLVDDHQLIREGLSIMLNEDPDIQVIGEAGNGEEGIELALRLLPDVILMDIQMPKISGIEAANRIKNQLPSVKIIMLTMYSTDAYIIQAVRAGAVGYALKDSSRELLCETIKNVFAGHVMIRSEMLRQALSRLVNNSRRGVFDSDSHATIQNLSERETEVLKLVTEGQTNRQIGSNLFISEATVKKHIQSIISKLDALDRTNAVAKAMRSGLIS